MNKTKNLTFISVKILHTINLNVHLHSENRPLLPFHTSPGGKKDF